MRINLYRDAAGRGIRELIRRREFGKELVQYSLIFLGIWVVALAMMILL